MPALLRYLQPSQPLPCILFLREAWVSVFPEGEEFFVMLDGFAFPAFFFIQFCQSVMILGMNKTSILTFWITSDQPFVFGNSFI